MIKLLNRILTWDCRRVLCIFGRHVWGKEPTLKEHIRFDAHHQNLLAVYGVQIGRKQCKLCGKPHPVPYRRQGIVGFGSVISPFSAGPWQEIDSKQVDLINAKPVIT